MITVLFLIVFAVGFTAGSEWQRRKAEKIITDSLQVAQNFKIAYDNR